MWLKLTVTCYECYEVQGTCFTRTDIEGVESIDSVESVESVDNVDSGPLLATKSTERAIKRPACFGKNTLADFAERTQNLEPQFRQERAFSVICDMRYAISDSDM